MNANQESAPKNKQEPAKTLTALERLDRLEKVVAGLEQHAIHLVQAQDLISGDMGTVKQAIRLLGNKVDAIAKLAESGAAINAESIGAMMVRNGAEELKARVDQMLQAGTLAKAETISANSFVVGEEIDIASGKVVNPRIQFPMFGLREQAIADGLIGKKAGDRGRLGDEKIELLITEVYEIAQPPQAEPQEAPAPQESDGQKTD